MTAQTQLKKITLRGKTAYYFDSRVFTYQGKVYEIVCSESTGRGVMDVKHTVKSENGNTKEVKMANLVKRLLAEELEI